MNSDIEDIDLENIDLKDIDDDEAKYESENTAQSETASPVKQKKSRVIQDPNPPRDIRNNND